MFTRWLQLLIGLGEGLVSSDCFFYLVHDPTKGEQVRSGLILVEGAFYLVRVIVYCFNYDIRFIIFL